MYTSRNWRQWICIWKEMFIGQWLNDPIFAIISHNMWIHRSKLRNIEIRFSLDEDETTPFLFPSNPQSEEKRDHSRFSPRVSCQDNRIPRVTTRPNRAPFRSLPFPRSVAWNRGDAKKEFPFKTIPRVSRAVHSRQIFTDFLHSTWSLHGGHAGTMGGQIIFSPFQLTVEVLIFGKQYCLIFY